MGSTEKFYVRKGDYKMEDVLKNQIRGTNDENKNILNENKNITKWKDDLLQCSKN